MELRHLRYFVLVAEELHFGRAAARAGIAQPPLSQQIRSLEAELGVSLFARTRRRVELTDAGRALLPRARRLLRDADLATEAARDGAKGLSGSLRVGFVGSLAFGFLSRFVQACRERVPDVTLSLRELTSEQQRRALESREIDFGLVRYPLHGAGIQERHLLREPLRVVLPESDPLVQRGGAVSVTELSDRPFVVFPRAHGPAFFDQVVGLCQAAGFSPRIGQEAIQMPTIVALVASGLGVAIVPESLSRIAVAGASYRELLDMTGQRPCADVFLVRRADEQSELLDRVGDLALDVARSFTGGN